MTPIRHRALVFDARLSAGNTANDMLVTGNTRSFCRLMCLCVKRRNVKPDSKHRSLPDSALFHADNRTEQKTILPFSLNIAAFRCPTLPDRCSFRNFGLNLFYEHLSIRQGPFCPAFDPPSGFLYAKAGHGGTQVLPCPAFSFILGTWFGEVRPLHFMNSPPCPLNVFTGLTLLLPMRISTVTGSCPARPTSSPWVSCAPSLTLSSRRPHK